MQCHIIYFMWQKVRGAMDFCTIRICEDDGCKNLSDHSVTIELYSDLPHRSRNGSNSKCNIDVIASAIKMQ